MMKSSLVSFLSRLSKRERLIFYMAVFFAGVVLLDQFILFPILSRMNQLGQEIKNQENQITKSFKILSHEKQIVQEKNKYASALIDPQSEEEDTTTFLRDIEDLAKKSSVYLVDIKPSGKNDTAAPKQYLIELNFEGQMEQVFNFFYDITHSDQLVKIERYQIRLKMEGSSIVTCSMFISKLIVSDL